MIQNKKKLNSNPKHGKHPKTSLSKFINKPKKAKNSGCRSNEVQTPCFMTNSYNSQKHSPKKEVIQQEEKHFPSVNLP